jgi:hypothetical protein
MAKPEIRRLKAEDICRGVYENTIGQRCAVGWLWYWDGVQTEARIRPLADRFRDTH